jgi:hypothetical protein
VNLKPGWINRQFARIEREFRTWPKWMKQASVEPQVTKRKARIVRRYERPTYYLEGE